MAPPLDDPPRNEGPPPDLNVFGEPLALCSSRPMTGFLRDGCCHGDPRDRGRHVICAEMTAEFLEYSQAQGNDLSTPRPEYDFVGLKPGDRWCLCALRWRQAWLAGKAPQVVLRSTHLSALEVVPIEALHAFALDLS